MAQDNRATGYGDANEEQRFRMIRNILSELKGINYGTAGEFGDAFTQAFNIDSEDRRDALFQRREAEGLAAIPPRAVQTLSQHPLIDASRQHLSIGNGPVANFMRSENPLARALRSIGIREFDDGMYSFRANAGLNIGGPDPSGNQLPDLQIDSTTGEVRKPTPSERLEIAADKRRLRELSVLQKAGYSLGGLANDFTNNATRNLWWLINAPQAVVDLASDLGVSVANPDLYKEEVVELQKAIDEGLVRFSPDVDQDKVKKLANEMRQSRQVIDPLPNLTGDPDGGYSVEADEAFQREVEQRAYDQLYSKDDAKNYKRAKPGARVRYDSGSKQFQVRRRAFSPTLVNLASMLPASIAINTGIGLMGGEDNGSITGRQAGYKAALPSEEDERRTSNAVAEVAWRYLLGREGQLLDQADFLLERPDVTAGEYQKYKGYLRDRGFDLNPFDDGKINIGGVIKTNPDGIRGAEVSFLGKSMGLNDTAVPVLSALGGSIAGALAGRRLARRTKGMAAKKYQAPDLLPEDAKGIEDARKRAKVQTIGALMGGGIAGLVGGQAAGTALEENRRQSRFEERNPQIDYDTYRSNARDLLDRKYELMAANPNAKQEKDQSKVGFNKRNQQQALLEVAQKQQAMIDQLQPGLAKDQSQQAMDKQMWALNQAAAIDEEIERRRKDKDQE